MYNYRMEVNANNVNIEELKKMATLIAMEQANNQAHPKPTNIPAKQASLKSAPLPPRPVAPKAVPQPKMPTPVPKKVSIQVSNTSEDVSDIVQMDNSNVVPNKGGNQDCEGGNQNGGDIVPVQNNDTFGIMGMNVPKSTLYFTIILILIAVAIWYMSKDKPKKKKKDDEDE